ncbi:outer membrane protein/protective antigen OMA87 [Cylindrospermum stagnale PCC 7417]|uniref:Outer membrane protein/protective antigen OMA87 n=1 Tax=Cylindrospermum stagnale PCC 7417 TaxID=56107 RepID=K9WZK0_9NOST|nr:BamA/TamA family outer membrane protein [Cylindrospermum stagnale]AFZ25244.1 outer membrane protein/protective antigen OMA87 [Cylindrospermum stagnale PCC 7417]
MRLSPGLIVAVAIATPLGGSLSANAQTANSFKQTTEVFTTETNQQPETDIGKSHASESRESHPKLTAVVVETEPYQSPVVKVSTGNSAAMGTPEVIVPTLSTPITPTSNAAALGTTEVKLPTAITPITLTANTTALGTTEVKLPTAIAPITAQIPQSTPNSTPQPTPAPDSQTNPTQEDINPPTAPPVFPTTPEAAEPRVLVSEVLVQSETGQISSELEDQVYKVIRTQPGQTTTRSQLQEDINAIFGTGFFANVQAVPEDTPLGVRVSFVVQPNPVLSKVEVQANPGTGVASVLPNNTVDEIFREQYGKILNLRDLQEGVKQLTKRYQDQGYVLANVIGAPQVAENGVVTLKVAEGVVENVKVRFRNKEGQEVDDKGNPIRGQTREYIIKRELELKPGQVFNRNLVQKDLQRVFGLGLFEDVNVSLDPGTDPSKVDVVVNVAERSSGSIAAGAGISSSSGLFGTVSYQQQNLGGRNQKLGAEVQVGQRELLFDLRFTDPWIAGDPYRTSYTANVFRRRSISLIFDGKDNDIETFEAGTTEGDRPRITRLGGGVTFTRPLSANPYKESEWTASAGLQYQRVSTRDADGDIRKEGTIFTNGVPGELIPLSQSGKGEDDLLLFQLGAQRDRRNNPLQPTSGSYLRLGVDQSVPIGTGNILLTRLRGNYSQYFPVKFIGKKPQTLAFNLQGGTVLGDLPPYEAFTIGGSNSVRGYEEGGLGSGRSYVQASVEYRFPVFSVVSGALFFDIGSDLGTSTKTAEVLNKNGSGYGYGLGVRVQSPLGPIRIDYGLNDDGDSRINFGIGERF